MQATNTLRTAFGDLKVETVWTEDREDLVFVSNIRCNRRPLTVDGVAVRVFATVVHRDGQWRVPCEPGLLYLRGFRRADGGRLSRGTLGKVKSELIARASAWATDHPEAIEMARREAAGRSTPDTARRIAA